MNDQRAARSFHHLWQAWRRLSRFERGATVAATVAIPTMALLLRLHPPERILAMMDRRPARGGGIGRDAETVGQLVRAAEGAGRYGFYRGDCLSRSLALLWLLRRRGLAAELQLGARLIDGQLEAHAWVERGGVALNESADVITRFAPFGVTPSSDDRSPRAPAQNSAP